MLSIIKTEIPNNWLELFNNNKDKFTPDVSNYAKGRLRTWLGCEAPLTDSQPFKKTHFDYNHWFWNDFVNFCKTYLNFKPEIGLLHIGGADCSNPEKNPTDGRGGECGIKMHRDAAYADFKAIGINLTEQATFGYKDCYGTQDCWKKEQNMNANIQTINMIPGTCVIFNCKNPHFAQVAPNRLGINAWTISKKRKTEFLEFINAK